MAALSNERIADLLHDFYPAPTQLLLDQISIYLDLLLKWNARTNLTAVRHPEEIVRRHFGESLFAATHLPRCSSVLDLGSGAGFPGIPIQLARRGLSVTLAESQNKKASFLREVVRTLRLPTVVWGNRVEEMPASHKFDVVTIRAVDHPDLAIELAKGRLAEGGSVVHLTTIVPVAGDFFAFPGFERSGVHIFR